MTSWTPTRPRSPTTSRTRLVPHTVDFGTKPVGKSVPSGSYVRGVAPLSDTTATRRRFDWDSASERLLRALLKSAYRESPDQLARLRTLDPLRFAEEAGRVFGGPPP